MEDVAEATAHILADTATAGRSYELAGPEVYTMRELVMIVLRIVGRRRALVSVPFAVARLQARLSGFLPNPPQSDSWFPNANFWIRRNADRRGDSKRTFDGRILGRRRAALQATLARGHHNPPPQRYCHAAPIRS